MRNDNYASASAVVRNLADLTIGHEVVHAEGKFRVVKLEAPFFGGYPYWVVNHKGFMWEPADTLDEALAYLQTDEAREYSAD